MKIKTNIMKKIKFKYGSISWNKNDMFIYLSNKSDYKQHEEIELIINDDNTLEINSKKQLKEMVRYNPYEPSIHDLSKYDLSEFKDIYDYIYEKTEGFLWNKKTTRYIDRYLTLKERVPCHIITSVKWYIWSDEDLNWNWYDNENK